MSKRLMSRRPRKKASSTEASYRGRLPPPDPDLEVSELMRHRTFFWFFLPTGLAMMLFIAAPIVSVVMQSVFVPLEPVLITVETCTPFNCSEETTIDQVATRELRDARPLGRFVGLDIYLNRGHLAIDEVTEAWRSSDRGILIR